MRETIETGGRGVEGAAGGIAGGGESSMSDSQAAYLSLASSYLVERMQIAGRLGLDQFGGRRKIYDTLGYPHPGTLTFADYRERFERGGIAKRVLMEAPKAMGWSGLQLVERPVAEHRAESKRAKAAKSGKIDRAGYTPFETAWTVLNERLGVGDAFERADIIAGIGEYSAIFIGVQDKKESLADPNYLETPLPRLRSSDDITYLRVLSQENIWITDYFGDTAADDPSDKRYGLPKFYRTRLGGNSRARSGIGNDTISTNIQEKKVHWTRIIHVTHSPLYDDVFSRPELEAIWNYLMDLDKLVGGGSEAFYREAVTRVLFNIDKDIDSASLNQTNPKTGKTFREDFKDSAEEMMHDLKQFMVGQGATPISITTTAKSFEASVRIVLTLIASTVERPQRILYGSESGHLASTQDQENANASTAARREGFGNRTARLFADRLIEYNGLPEPSRYESMWPDENESTDLEKAQIIAALSLGNLHQHQADGTINITNNEMRDRWLDLDELIIIVEPVTLPSVAPIDPNAPGIDPNTDPAAVNTATIGDEDIATK